MSGEHTGTLTRRQHLLVSPRVDVALSRSLFLRVVCGRGSSQKAGAPSSRALPMRAGPLPPAWDLGLPCAPF